MKAKPVIGILGGIGSGKSTVARLFGELGCEVIDADRLAHEQLARPEIVARLVESFGPQIAPNGAIDRARLAEIIFQSRENVEKINALIHPPVLTEVEKRLQAFRRGPAPAVVLDVPLLAETGWEKRCDVLVFVDTNPEVRAQRAAKKGPSYEKSIKNRENYQISLDFKRNIAHYSISNNSDFSELADQVAKIFSYVVSNG